MKIAKWIAQINQAFLGVRNNLRHLVVSKLEACR
jgi:hypothetical protein